MPEVEVAPPLDRSTLLRDRLAAMAARHGATLDPEPEAPPTGPPPDDDEALANLQAGFPGAVIQETIQRNG